MTLPPARTAPEAVRYFARTLREGVLYGRTPRMEELREYYTAQLREQYETGTPIEFSPHFGHSSQPVAPMKASCHVKVIFPELYDGQLPATWKTRFYERLRCPPPIEDAGQDKHPFRLVLEITRGKFAFPIPVHDFRSKWLGRAFKASSRGGFYPLGEEFGPLSTYMVFADAL